MPRNITVTFADGTSHTYQGAPDNITPDEVQARAEKQFSKAVRGIDGGAKVGGADQIPTEPGANTTPTPAGQPDSFLQKIGGVGETALALGSGMAGGLAGSVAGLYKGVTGGKYGTPKGAQEADKYGGDVAQSLTYQPRTQTGQDLTQAAANAFQNSGLIAVAPMAGEVSALSRAAPASMRAITDAGRAEAGYIGEALRAGSGAMLNPVAGSLQSGARWFMQSAIKPTIKQLQSGDAAIAVKTLLDEGISPTQKGALKLRELINQKNSQIEKLIGDSSATVSRDTVLRTLNDDVAAKFKNQVNPTPDLNAIANIADDFANHPSIKGDAIPVQLAQQLKQGTYRVLDKKYGQLGSADVEAQKGLARGLKNEIGKVVPEVTGLNAQESALFKTLDVAERRAFMEANKNPVGLSALTTSPAKFALFMADRSAGFKALMARAMNRVGESLKVENPGFAKVQPEQAMPGTSNLARYDYRNATVLPEEMQNWTYGRPDANVTTGPQPMQPSLNAPSAESTLRGVSDRRMFDRNMAASLDQSAQSNSTLKAALNRQTTGRGTLFDLDPITGRLKEASQGLKGATPDTFQNFGNALQSASEKVAKGQKFALTAAEKVAWERTRADLATAAPELRGLSDAALTQKMLDRNWVAQAISKAKEKANAFDKIAKRADDAQAARAANASRERMLDLLETLEEDMRIARPQSSGIQGPKTRAFSRDSGQSKLAELLMQP